MKHKCFFSTQALGIYGEHVLVFSPDVLGDWLPWSFDKYLDWKDANVGCFIATLNLWSADAFFRRVKATFRTKNVRRKRQDNAGKDKISHLFLETGKSAVEFWVGAITKI